MLESDEFYMRKAIDAARAAETFGEIPIGACLIGADGEILAVAGNRTILQNDPTAHAEILALREAGQKISNYRFAGSTMFSTVEPCAMCAGALVNARVKRLVYGAADLRFGAVKTHFHICGGEILNHQIEITNGVLAGECRDLMQNFFKKKRELQKLNRTNENST